MEVVEQENKVGAEDTQDSSLPRITIYREGKSLDLDGVGQKFKDLIKKCPKQKL